MARQPRRVRTEPKPGVDPTPQRFPATNTQPETIRATLASEDQLDVWGGAVVDVDAEESLIVREDVASDSNDERLLDNVPPHNV
ncbi:MAG: hypothetical protein ACTHXA_09485 [Gulosibacter sp.]|uniref:hypothetical protein n=1 Tax=Gulosibacter sp. TaxID=2817531 RepID=UPI003F919E36